VHVACTPDENGWRPTIEALELVDLVPVTDQTDRIMAADRSGAPCAPLMHQRRMRVRLFPGLTPTLSAT